MTASSSLSLSPLAPRAKSKSQKKPEMDHLTKEVHDLERDIALHPIPGTSEAPPCVTDGQAEAVGGRRKCLPRAAKKRASVQK